MVVLSVMVSSRIPTKSVQIVHVMTFFGSGMSKNNFRIRNLEFGIWDSEFVYLVFVKICGEQLNTHYISDVLNILHGVFNILIEINLVAMLRLCFL